MRIIITGLVIISFFFGTWALAGTVNLPKTGQTKCYDNDGVELLDCSGTGQDGDAQKGASWPGARFIKSTYFIKDTLTGLYWAKDSCMAKKVMSWADAVDYAYNLSYGGLSDWRLPNINELNSLYHAGMTDGAAWLSEQGFGINFGISAGTYWSSTSDANIPDGLAWGMDFDRGIISSFSKTYDELFVWPVRGGQIGGPAAMWRTGQTVSERRGDDAYFHRGVTWPTQRYVDQGEEVSDLLTGLTWTKETHAPGPEDCGVGYEGTWQDALDYVHCLNVQRYLGHNSWRLPNRVEFLSVIDRSQYSPVLQEDHPFIYRDCNHWSSTSDGHDPRYAWNFSMRQGFLDTRYKGNTGHCVWPVRNTGNITLRDITVVKTGSGEGSVVSDPSGIDCGVDCETQTASFAAGSDITLTATAPYGSTFTYWTGGCTGETNPCTQISYPVVRPVFVVDYPLEFTLLTPVGHEVLGVGSPFRIRGDAPLDPVATSKWDIFYSIDGGTTWLPRITEVTGFLLDYLWTAPEVPRRITNARIKIVGYNYERTVRTGTAISGKFTIEPVHLAWPNGGEVLTSQDNVEITWDTYTFKGVSSVRLFYSFDEGSTWKPIPSSGTSSPADWRVPAVTKPKTRCKVKLVLKDSSGKTIGSDTSDWNFTIEPVVPGP